MFRNYSDATFFIVYRNIHSELVQAIHLLAFIVQTCTIFFAIGNGMLKNEILFDKVTPKVWETLLLLLLQMLTNTRTCLTMDLMILTKRYLVQKYYFFKDKMIFQNSLSIFNLQISAVDCVCSGFAFSESGSTGSTKN